MAKASDNVFPRFLISEGGSTATPAAAQVTVYAKANGLLYSKDDAGAETALGGGAGSVATDVIWDVAGDLVQGTGANTAARLALGAVGTVVRSTGTTNAYALPAGHEFDYAQITADASSTATTEATAVAIVTGAAVTYDGTTTVMVEFSCISMAPAAAAAATINIYLYDNGASIGQIGLKTVETAGSSHTPVRLARRLTPSAAAHTYSIRASVSTATGTVYAGAGGLAANMPAFLRITKV